VQPYYIALQYPQKALEQAVEAFAKVGRELGVI